MKLTNTWKHGGVMLLLGIALDIDCTSEVYGYCILKVKL